MPFYEYRRPDGTIFEVMQRMADAPLTEDPETGVPVQRVFHPIAVHFKGKGFYNTDYGTKKRARENAGQESSSSKASSGEGGDSTSGGESGGETGSAATPDSGGGESAKSDSSPSKSTVSPASSD